MKTIVLMLGFVLSASVSAQKPECKKFRNGDFMYTDKQTSLEITVKREGETQIEYNPDFDMTIISKVIWKSDCEYELVYQKIEGALGNGELPEKSLYCRILETEGDTFKVHARSGKTDPGYIYNFKKVDVNTPAQ